MVRMHGNKTLCSSLVSDSNLRTEHSLMKLAEGSSIGNHQLYVAIPFFFFPQPRPTNTLDQGDNSGECFLLDGYVISYFR